MIQKFVTEKRKHPRHETWQAVQVRLGGKVHVCDLIQISNSGAAVELSPDLIVQPKSKIELTFVNGTKTMAEVVWVRSGKIGIKFDINFLSHADLLHYDYMGYDLYRHMVKLQKLRTTTS